MTMEELKRIVEDIIMTDPWTSTNKDYQHFTLEECAEQLKETRKYNIDLEPEDQIPDDLTPEKLKELWDEIVREHWEALRDSARRFLLSNEGNYDYPFNKYIEDYKERYGVVPHPWVYSTDHPFCGENCDEPEYSIHDFARLVKKSPDYDPNKPFLWYDGTQLHSAENIYPDIIDVDVIVNYCIDNCTGLDYAIEELM